MADAETKAQAEALAARVGWLGPAAVRPMFGALAVLVDDAMVAFVARGTIFLRADDAVRETLVAEGSEPFSYQRDGHRVAMKNYFSAPAAVLADDAAFRAVLEAGHRHALAARKARKPRRRTKAR